MKAPERSHWASWTASAALASIVFYLNVYLCRELFRIEYIDAMGSIEGGFIGLAHYISRHWHDLIWVPVWNAGTPFATTYPPLLHIVVALCANLFHTSPAHAYHAVIATVYCLGPVALFALALRFTGSKWAAFAAGALYSSLSISIWIIPVIHRDIGNYFYLRRLQTLTFYGEGPHVSSMTLLVFALLFLDLAIERRRAWWFLLAAVFFGATAATNWLGAFATILIVVPYVFAQTGQKGWRWREFAWLAAIAIAAYCLVMPLVPPSTIGVMIKNAKNTGGDFERAYRAAIPQALAIFAALAGLKFAARKLSRPMQFAIYFAFLITLVTMADAFWHVALIPMGQRYHLEMELALTLLALMIAHAALRNRPRWAAAALCAMVIALIPAVRTGRWYARRVLLRPIDITKTIEWRESQWFNQHWNGERVFVPGSISFWLTAFSDTPELWGFDQAVTDYQIRVANYAIYSDAAAGDHAAENSILWLKAFGVHAVAVSGPAGAEHYHPWVHPMKFEGVLEPLWRDGDDVIYRLGKDAPLARVVPRQSLIAQTPENGIDFTQIRRYVAALDDPAMPAAQVDWVNQHDARIAANLNPDQAISMQIAWAKGWHASVNGRDVPVEQDGIGLMYFAPGIAGPVNIEFHYDGGMEHLISMWASWLAAIGMLLGCAYNFRGVLFSRKS